MPRRRYNMDEKAREALHRERTADNRRFASSGVRKKEADRERIYSLLERCLEELLYFKLRHGDFKPQLLGDLSDEIEKCNKLANGG